MEDIYKNSLRRHLEEEEEKNKKKVSSEEFARQKGLSSEEDINKFNSKVTNFFLGDTSSREDTPPVDEVEPKEVNTEEKRTEEGIERIAKERELEMLNERLPQIQKPLR